MPNQERLVFKFLEGLLNKKLHVALYPMKYKTLVAYIKDAIELDDNVDEYKYGRTTRLGDMGSQTSTKLRVYVRETQPIVTTSQAPTIQEVANEIIRKLNMNQRPPIRTEPLCQ